MSNSVLKSIILVILTGLPTLIIAQTPPWQRINPIPFECSINDAQLLPNGRIIAVGDLSTVVTTVDFGNNWSILYNPANAVYNTDLKSVCFFDDNNGWAVGDMNTIIRSFDGGLSWDLLQQASSYPYYTYSDVEFISDTEGFVIRDSFSDDLYKTLDAGQNWIPVQGLENFSFNKIKFVSHEVGFMHGGGDYILKSTDTGASWQKIIISPGIENLGIETFYFIDEQVGFIGATVNSITNSDHYIYKTEDGGHTWEEVFFDYAYSSWGFSFSNTDTGYSVGPVVWYRNNILRTVDGGDSWELMTDTIGYWHLKTLCSDDNGNVIAFGRRGQVYNSYNYGANWYKSFSNSIIGHDIVSSAIIDDSSIIMSGEGGTGGVSWFRNIISHDRGNTWTETEDYYGIVYDLCYLNDTVGFYCGGYGFSGGNNFIFKTINAGIDWEFTEVGSDENILMKIEFIDDSTGFVGGMSEDYGYFILFRTDNCGESWDEVNIGYYTELCCEFDFYNDSSAIIAGYVYPADSNAQIIKTIDRGNTWFIDTLPFDTYFSHVHFMNQDTGILFGWNKICKTVDAGAAWYQVDFDYNDYVTQELTYEFIENVGYLYLQGMNPRMFKTEDFGDTWYEIEEPSTSIISTISFFTPDEGIVAGENSVIFKTLTGGLVSLPEWGNNKYGEEHLLIYPNPTQRHFTVVIPEGYENGIIRLYDLQGRLISNYTYSNAGELSGELNFQNGIYIVMIENTFSRLSGKLIIMD